MTSNNFAASIFYNRSSWHCLLIKVIKAFIAMEKKRNVIESWSVYLSNVQGDHISLFVNSLDSYQLQKQFAEMAERFLHANPSSNNTVTYPLKSFFMDYPNNSIQINNQRLFSKEERNNKSQQQNISHALIEVLGDDVIDAASVYTFLIYMQLGIIRASYPSIGQAYSKLADLLHYLKNHDNTEIDKRHNLSGDDAVLAKLFESNKKLLPEIIQDVWNDDIENTLKWLNDWIDACGSFVNQSEFNQNFFQLSSMLCRHLGLEDKTINPLSCQLIVSSFNRVNELGNG